MLPGLASSRPCLLLTLICPFFTLIDNKLSDCLLVRWLIGEEAPLASCSNQASVAFGRSWSVDSFVGAHSFSYAWWLLHASDLIFVKDLFIERILIQITSDISENTGIWIVVPKDITRISHDATANWTSMKTIEVVSTLDERRRLSSDRGNGSSWQTCFLVCIVSQRIVISGFQSIGSELHVIVLRTDAVIRIDSRRNQVIVCELSSSSSINLGRWCIVPGEIDGATLPTEWLILPPRFFLGIACINIFWFISRYKYLEKSLLIDANVLA